MGLIDSIKKDIAKSGQSKSKILYVRDKVRVRFLQELDDGYSFVFHSKFEDGVNCVCPKEFDEDNECIHCGDETVRTRKNYAWTVYNLDTKEVQIALFAVNQCTPVSQLIVMSESYGTIMDRDYVLVKSGKQMTTSYTVIPQDKQKFRNENAKPYTRDAVLKILKEAFPYDSSEKVEEEKPAKKAKTESGYAQLEEDDVPWEKETTKKEKKAKEESTGLSIEKMEEKLEDNDIDVDEFCEYFEVKSLKKLTSKTPKEFKKMVKEYLDSLEEDEDDDFDDEDDE